MLWFVLLLFVSDEFIVKSMEWVVEGFYFYFESGAQGEWESGGSRGLSAFAFLRPGP